MSRINTNVQSLIAQRVLTQQYDRLNLSLERLSTGLRINSGKDDPAGLIASEAMRAEMNAISAAQTNVSRAMNVVSVAESGLNEISSLLNDLETLIDRSANETGISPEEADANQQEIDLILGSIDRIANSTELQGRKLLAGDIQYNTSSVASNRIADLDLNSVLIPEGQWTQVTVDVVTSAYFANLTYTGGALGSANTLEVTGNLGTTRIALASGSAVADIVAAINMNRDVTGVSAVVSGTDAVFTSIEDGESQFVRVKALSGSQVTANISATEDTGQDAEAIVNGQLVVGDGRQLAVRTPVLDASIELDATWSRDASGASTQFEVTGGGAKFAISPTLDANGQVNLGIEALATTNLGKTGEELYLIGTGQTYSMDSGNYYQAQRIVRQAQQEVATLRGRLGSFYKNTLETTKNSLMVQYENVASAESVLRDTDFASETSNLTRSQILVQSASNVLKLANASPQNVLALIG